MVSVATVAAAAKQNWLKNKKARIRIHPPGRFFKKIGSVTRAYWLICNYKYFLVDSRFVPAVWSVPYCESAVLCAGESCCKCFCSYAVLSACVVFSWDCFKIEALSAEGAVEYCVEAALA